MHQRSTHQNAIPLLFTHGWPGHFHEVANVLPLLTEAPEGAQAFHVVAPSIPGFGFSTNPPKKGFNVDKIAETLDSLMAALGYDEYVAQGGDWGSSVSRMLGVKFPARCRAVHVNLQKGLGPPVWWRNPWVWVKMHSQLVSYSAEEEYIMARTRWFAREETGYRVLSACCELGG